MLYEFLRPISIVLFHFLFRLKVEGKECIPSKGPFILASNHLSNIDPVVLGTACPRRLYFVAKEELFHNRAFARLIKILGAVPLKRGRPSHTTIKKVIALLDEGKPVVIFPQGRRTREFTAGFSGVGFLYKKTGVPVVVCRITGTDYVLPRGSKSIRLYPVSVVFRRIEDLKREDSPEVIAKKILERIKNI